MTSEYIIDVSIIAMILTPIFIVVQVISLKLAVSNSRLKPEHFSSIQSCALKSRLTYEDLFQVCEDAIKQLSVTDTRAMKDKGIVVAKVKGKGLSWGLCEDVRIVIKKNGIIDISSKSQDALNVIDLGRNVKNVQLIATYINAYQ